MKAPHSAARDWTNHLLGIATETAYVLALLGVAGTVASLVTLR